MCKILFIASVKVIQLYSFIFKSVYPFIMVELQGPGSLKKGITELCRFQLETVKQNKNVTQTFLEFLASELHFLFLGFTLWS